MPILKKGFKKDFTTLSNYCFKDKSLSFKEVGLLCNMISLPDDWKFNVRGLTTLHTDGYESVANTLNSLIEKGYVYREQQMPSKETNGKLGEIVYWIYDNPENNPYFKGFNQRTGNPITELQRTGNQFTEIQFTDNPELSNTKQLNTNKFNINNNNINQNKTYNNTAIIEKHGNSVVENKKYSKGFNIDRFINCESVRSIKSRIDEAMRNDELSNNAISYLIDSFNCFGSKQISVINSFTDDEFGKLYNITIQLLDKDHELHETINNPKSYLSSQISKSIADHNLYVN